MSNTVKTIYHGARDWWREYRALDREKKHLFVAIAVGLIVIYFVLTGMSKLTGRLERETEMNAALQRLSPQAVEAVRQACKNMWETSPECSLFYQLREKRSR